MCEEWWFQRRTDEGEASRRMWEEFERTRPQNVPEVPEEESEVILEKPEATPLTAKS